MKYVEYRYLHFEGILLLPFIFDYNIVIRNPWKEALWFFSTFLLHQDKEFIPGSSSGRCTICIQNYVLRYINKW